MEVQGDFHSNSKCNGSDLINPHPPFAHCLNAMQVSPLPQAAPPTDVHSASPHPPASGGRPWPFLWETLLACLSLGLAPALLKAEHETQVWPIGFWACGHNVQLTGGHVTRAWSTTLSSGIFANLGKGKFSFLWILGR